MTWLQSPSCVQLKLEDVIGWPGCGTGQVGSENMLDIDGSDWAW